MSVAERVKIVFGLPKDEDDANWPPVTEERVWAEPLGDGLYRVDNIPFFVRDLACGDVVEAIPHEGSPEPIAVRLVEASGHLTVRVIPFGAGRLQGDLQAVIDIFAQFGVDAEGAGPSYRLVALDIPPEADVAALAALLNQERAQGTWDFDVGAGSEAFNALVQPPPDFMLDPGR